VLGFYPAPALRLVDEPAAQTIEHVGGEPPAVEMPIAVDGDSEGSEQ
jgi:hypothetical protein